MQTQHPFRRWQLQQLDERALPSVTFREVDNILIVKGDTKANTIDITDNGTGTAGNISVMADGIPYTSTGAITDLRVVTGNQKDAVTYHLDELLAEGVSLKLWVSLGNQDDTFNAILDDKLSAGSNLEMKVYGGNGNDVLIVDASHSDVAADATLLLKMYGGNGTDSLALDYWGLVAGNVDVLLNGGNGKDTIDSDLILSPGSTGEVKAAVWGGNSVDTLSMTLTKDAVDAPSIEAFIRGGHGKDDVFGSTDVTVIQ
jgi:hypothetical protein